MIHRFKLVHMISNKKYYTNDRPSSVKVSERYRISGTNGGLFCGVDTMVCEFTVDIKNIQLNNQVEK